MIILILAVGATLMAIGLIFGLKNDWDGWDAAFVVIGIVVLLFGMGFGAAYFVAGEQVKIVNEMYNTHYTTREWFYAGANIEKKLRSDEGYIDSAEKLHFGKVEIEIKK